MLTRSGLGALVAAVLLIAAGWWWGYEELVISGLAVAIAVMMAVWGAQRPFRVHIKRRVISPRVARGDPIQVAYRVENATSRRSTGATLIDRCDAAVCELAIEPLRPGELSELTGWLATRRRGLFEVGPWSVERLDPFRLAIGQRSGEGSSPVIVHPRVYDLAGPHGTMQTVESEAVLRRAASDPLSGFVSLREYVQGDDPRMIHWPTTARTGTLMVREHVELRRPEFTVVLDTSLEVSTPDDFEELVDVVASIAMHSLRTGLEVVVRTTSPEHSGRPRGLSDEYQILELLTVVDQTPVENLLSVPALFASSHERASIVVVTGPTGPSSRLPASEQTTIVRIGEGAQLAPGVALVARDAKEFSQRWLPWA